MPGSKYNLRWVAGNIVLATRFLLGSILVASALPKIGFPQEFLSSVYEYGLVHAKFGVLIALCLPWVELALGLCLLSGFFVAGAMLGTSLLMAVFTLAQASVLGRGLAIRCGCFSPSEAGLIGYTTLTRTGLLLAAAMVGFLCLLFLASAACGEGRLPAATPFNPRKTEAQRPDGEDASGRLVRP